MWRRRSGALPVRWRTQLRRREWSCVRRTPDAASRYQLNHPLPHRLWLAQPFTPPPAVHCKGRTARLGPVQGPFHRQCRNTRPASRTSGAAAPQVPEWRSRLDLWPRGSGAPQTGSQKEVRQMREAARHGRSEACVFAGFQAEGGWEGAEGGWKSAGLG